MLASVGQHRQRPERVVVAWLAPAPSRARVALRSSGAMICLLLFFLSLTRLTVLVANTFASVDREFATSEKCLNLAT